MIDEWTDGERVAIENIADWLDGNENIIAWNPPRYAPLWRWCLASNLAVAGGLCEAFYSGFSEGFSASGEGFNGEYAPRLTAEKFQAMAQSTDTDQHGPTWKPGCGKAAP